MAPLPESTFGTLQQPSSVPVHRCLLFWLNVPSWVTPDITTCNSISQTCSGLHPTVCRGSTLTPVHVAFELVAFGLLSLILRY
jgi:hypothetical protein